MSDLEAENTRLRAALAMSDRPCAYCSLSAEDWAKCRNGFPGCDRADDSLGCPHLGTAMASAPIHADFLRPEEGRVIAWDGRKWRIAYWDADQLSRKPRPFWQYEGRIPTTATVDRRYPPQWFVRLPRNPG